MEEYRISPHTIPGENYTDEKLILGREKGSSSI
jgi:hypothetical protein